jgi:cobaltochelatase CobS
VASFDDLVHSAITPVPSRALRDEVQVSLAQTFGLELGQVLQDGEPVLGSDGSPMRKDRKIMAFKSPGSLTPAINPHYKFPKEETVMFLFSLANGDTTYIVGHSGTGKTELVRQVAARLNYNVVQINFDGHLLRADLVGEVRLISGDTKFRYGLVPVGFSEPGTIILFDEVDAVSPETAFVLQRAISEDRKFLLHETNELFSLHPQNRLVATANTNGLGDETSLYIAGTNIQNFSFLNRWATTIKLDYLSAEDEQYILRSLFPKRDPGVIKGICEVMAASREAFKNNTLSMPLTTRDAVSWMTKLNDHPFPMRSAKYSFLNKMNYEDALIVAEYIQRHFRLPERDDYKFVQRNAGASRKL